MPRFENTIDVAVPVRTAYDQWTQFEAFPQFMEGVERVVQLDDRHLEWTASVAGSRKQWTAEITDQTPDTRIAWKSTSGAENAGAVLFQPLGPDRTRVTLKIDADPEGPVETVGAAVGLLEGRVKGDLERYREFVESGGATGEGWRGEIHGDDVRPSPGDPGAYIGREPELASETIPGGVRPQDDRVASHAAESAVPGEPGTGTSIDPADRREAGQDR